MDAPAAGLDSCWARGSITDKYIVSALREQVAGQVRAGRRVTDGAEGAAGAAELPVRGAHGPRARTEALVADPEVERRRPWRRRATCACRTHCSRSRQSKHMLVEKPVGLDARVEPERMEKTAAPAIVFWIEAISTLFPAPLRRRAQTADATAPIEEEAESAHAGRRGPVVRRRPPDNLARSSPSDPMLDVGTLPMTLAISVLSASGPVRAVRHPRADGISSQFAMAFSPTTCLSAEQPAHRRHLSDAPSFAGVQPAHSAASTSTSRSTDYEASRPSKAAQQHRPGLGRAAHQPRRPALRGSKIARRVDDGGPGSGSPAHGPTRWRRWR